MAFYSGVLRFADGDIFRVQRLAINGDSASLDAVLTWDGREYSYTAPGAKSSEETNTFVFVGVPVDIHPVLENKLKSDEATVTLRTESSDTEMYIDGTYVEHIYDLEFFGTLRITPAN